MTIHRDALHGSAVELSDLELSAPKIPFGDTKAAAYRRRDELRAELAFSVPALLDMLDAAERRIAEMEELADAAVERRVDAAMMSVGNKDELKAAMERFDKALDSYAARRALEAGRG